MGFGFPLRISEDNEQENAISSLGEESLSPYQEELKVITELLSGRLRKSELMSMRVFSLSPVSFDSLYSGHKATNESPYLNAKIQLGFKISVYPLQSIIRI